MCARRWQAGRGHSWVTRHPIVSYALVLPYAVSWSVERATRLAGDRRPRPGLPSSLYYLAAFWSGGCRIRGSVGCFGRLQRALRRGQPSVTEARLSGGWSGSAHRCCCSSSRQSSPVSLARRRQWTSFWPRPLSARFGVMAWGLWLLDQRDWRRVWLAGLRVAPPAQTHSAVTAVCSSRSPGPDHLPLLVDIPELLADPAGLRVLPGFFLGLLAGSIVLAWL